MINITFVPLEMLVSSKFPLFYVILRETVAVPSFDTAEPIEGTPRLESAASYRNTMDKLPAKWVMQFSPDPPLIVTGLRQIAAIKAMVDFALPGLTLERSHSAVDTISLSWYNNP
jgi:hypothetical protein